MRTKMKKQVKLLYEDTRKITEKLGGYFERLEKNPIIQPNMKGILGPKGRNINGPSLIKIPDWIENPLGKYYLYFGHHGGKYIRLAFANNIDGPYKIYKPGTLHLKNLPFKTKHIASPEIVIKNNLKEIWMYYHASIRGKGIYKDQGQMTYLAKSKDGINFIANDVQLAPFYLRVFKYGNFTYGIAKNDNDDGILVRSKDGETLFERGSTFIKGFRHTAIWVKNQKIGVFFSKKGDKPERILYTEFDLSAGDDWKNWTHDEPITIIEPKEKWEGVKLKLVESKYGGTKPTRALRDPALYEENGDLYLLYSVKGEHGIGIAKFIPQH